MIWHLEQKGTIPFATFLRKADGPGAVPGKGQGKKFPLSRFITKSLRGSSGFAAAAAVGWLSRARALGGRRKCNEFPQPLELHQLKLSLKFLPAKKQCPFPASKSLEMQLHNPSGMAQQCQAEQQSPGASGTRASSLSVGAELSIPRDIPPPDSADGVTCHVSTTLLQQIVVIRRCWS